MGFEYASGDEVTNNKHLAEAIDLTREGTAPIGGEYDEPMGQGETLRGSCFYSALDALRKVDSAAGENQEAIDDVIRKLESAQHTSPERQQQAMIEAHDSLQDVWVPPTD